MITELARSSMVRVILLAASTLLLQACAGGAPPTKVLPAGYLDYSGRDDVLSGGVRMIPINTPKGVFRVWTKRVGNNPTIKVLLLHGGPGATHEYFEPFDSYFPAAGVEYYFYDRLQFPVRLDDNDFNPDLPQPSRFRHGPRGIEGIYSDGSYTVKFWVETSATTAGQRTAVVAALNEWLAGRG